MPPHNGEALRTCLHQSGAHPAVVDSLLDTGQLEAVLADDAAHTGRAVDGQDYRDEAHHLAPALLTVMRTVTAREIAALHTASPHAVQAP